MESWWSERAMGWMRSLLFTSFRFRGMNDPFRGTTTQYIRSLSLLREITHMKLAISFLYLRISSLKWLLFEYHHHHTIWTLIASAGGSPFCNFDCQFFFFSDINVCIYIHFGNYWFLCLWCAYDANIFGNFWCFLSILNMFFWIFGLFDSIRFDLVVNFKSNLMRLKCFIPHSNRPNYVSVCSLCLNNSYINKYVHDVFVNGLLNGCFYI